MRRYGTRTQLSDVWLDLHPLAGARGSSSGIRQSAIDRELEMLDRCWHDGAPQFDHEFEAYEAYLERTRKQQLISLE
jgi:hypothetical protein